MLRDLPQDIVRSRLAESLTFCPSVISRDRRDPATENLHYPYLLHVGSATPDLMRAGTTNRTFSDTDGYIFAKFVPLKSRKVIGFKFKLLRTPGPFFF